MHFKWHTRVVLSTFVLCSMDREAGYTLVKKICYVQKSAMCKASSQDLEPNSRLSFKSEKILTDMINLLKSDIKKMGR
jgi:hypothetical protein